MAPTIDPTTLNRLMLTGGIIAGSAVAAHHGLGYLKDRFTSINRPSWDMLGLAKMYGNQGGTVRYVRGQEKMIQGMYDIPYDIVRDRALDISKDIYDAPGKMYDKYKLNAAFDRLVDDPSVRAMGKTKARAMYKELGAIAPDLVRKAPHTVIPSVQGALLSDSMGINPEIAYRMVDANRKMKGGII